MVSEGGDTNRNASRRYNGDFDVIVKCKFCQNYAGLRKNRSIVGMRFQDCKYGLSEEVGEYMVLEFDYGFKNP